MLSFDTSHLASDFFASNYKGGRGYQFVLSSKRNVVGGDTACQKLELRCDITHVTELAKKFRNVRHQQKGGHGINLFSGRLLLLGGKGGLFNLWARACTLRGGKQ